MNHKPTPQGEEMSKHPPRVKMTYKPGGRPQVATQPRMDAENHVYLSLSEAQEMAERAREEAFNEAANDLLEAMEDFSDNDDAPGLLVDYLREKSRSSASSKPSPQGGGEKKEGSK